MEHTTEVMNKSYHDREKQEWSALPGRAGNSFTNVTSSVLVLGLGCVFWVEKRKAGIEDSDNMPEALAWHVLEKFSVCE